MVEVITLGHMLAGRRSVLFARRPASTRLLQLVCLLAAGCAGSPRGESPDLDRFHWPVHVAASQDGHTVFVVSSNFDAAYRGGTVIPVDVTKVSGKTTPVPLADCAVPGGGAVIGSFGGVLKLLRLASTTVGYVAIREGDLLQWFTVEDGPDGQRVSCSADGRQWCDSEHETRLEWKEPGGRTLTVQDPYAVEVGMGLGSPLVYVGGIKNGGLMALTVGDDGRPTVAAGVVLQSGIHSIVEGPAVEGRRIVYASNRFRNAIHVVTVQQAGALTLDVHDPVVISQVSSTGDYWRGMAISPDGRRLYAALRSPPSLAVFDIAPATGSLSLRGLVPLSGGPAEVAVVPGSTAGDDTVYVTDFTQDSLYTVDVLTLSVRGRIVVGDGPYGIAVTEADQGVGRRAFVALFEEAALSVVDLDPASKTYHTEIAKIK